MSVLVETTLGDFVIDLFAKERPKTCLNFVKLCKIKYYNFCVFHSIEEGYIAQTGDPTGTGNGGECVFSLAGKSKSKPSSSTGGVYFEMESMPKLRHKRRGTVSMVNNGDDAHGSQFFITLDHELDYLDGKHTVFGQVAEGWDTIDKLNDTLCDEEHRPYQDVRIAHTIILDDPFEDPTGLRVPRRSPSPTPELLKSSRLGIDEAVNPDEGKSEEVIREEMEAKDAKARAQILEMIGDLHHADEAPPDNVLFVCKLNAVTTDEDLEIIFSRFGKIKCCEIIRDKKSGNSLQYAFIEFENPKDCEAAYFKMDNVLIDDRRIHVDFSQSVSKNYTWDRQGDGSAKTTTVPKSEPKPSVPERRQRSRSPADARNKRSKRDRSRDRDRNRDRDRDRYRDRDRNRHANTRRSRSRSRDRRRYRDSDERRTKTTSRR